MSKSKSMCSGCYNDFYNHKEKNGCWCYGNAKVVTRTLVGVWQNPPYKWIPQKTLSCHRPKGQCWIEKNDCRIKE